MAHEHPVEVEGLQSPERLSPMVRIAVTHERGPPDHRVAGHDEPLSGQVDEHVALRVGAAQVVEVDLPVALEEPHGVLEGDGRERGLEGADLG